MKYSAALFLTAVVLSILCFHPLLSGHFDLDDDYKYLARGIDTALWNPSWIMEPQGRPLSQGLYFSIMVRLFGAWPAPYFILNILLHCINAVLCGLIIKHLIGSWYAAFFTTAIIATHHVAAEIIGDISCITESLLGPSFYGAIFFWLIGKNRIGTLLWLIALGTKQTAVIAPLIYIAAAGISLNRDLMSNRLIRQISIIGIIYFLYSLGVTGSGSSIVLGSDTMRGFSFLMNLDIFSIHGPATRQKLMASPALPLAAAAMISMLMIRFLPWKRAVLTSVLVIVLTTLPLSMFISPSLRHLYLAVPGYAWIISMLAMSVKRLTHKKNKISNAIATMLILLGIFGSYESLQTVMYVNETQVISRSVAEGIHEYRLLDSKSQDKFVIKSENAEFRLRKVNKEGKLPVKVDSLNLEKRYSGRLILSERISEMFKVYDFDPEVQVISGIK